MGENELDRYGYDERLPREEIISEYSDDVGETFGFVSRNSYGALILNTRDLMFIDIDLPPKPQVSLLSTLASLFSKASTAEVDPAEEAIFGNIKEVASRHADLGFRVYRTFNGFRVIVTNEQLLPDSRRAQELLKLFGSDPLYVRMCKNQQCFRARLTPKAWRCKVKEPLIRYPFADEQAESEYRRWEKEYSRGAQSYSTCNYQASFGPEGFHPSLEGLIAIHDKLTKADSTDPLA